MKKTLSLILAIAMLLAVCTAAMAEQQFDAVTAEDGTVYDLFVITKMNYGEGHKVESVTGHFERVASREVVSEDENEFSPEALADSETTFYLADDFRALMPEEPNGIDNTVTVTDLYQWFVDTYLGGEEELEGRELVFQCDFPEEEQLDATYDFGFLTTKIRLNDDNNIEYMENVWVPWG